MTTKPEPKNRPKSLSEEIWLLTDGHEIIESRMMDKNEAEDENQNAADATDQNYYWSCVGTPEKVIQAVNGHDALVKIAQNIVRRGLSYSDMYEEAKAALKAAGVR